MLAQIKDWILNNERILQQFGSLSLLLLLLTLLALVIVVVTLPKDYFTRDHREPTSRTHLHPLPWRSLSLLKNMVGILFILLGLALLVLPGQGTLTILIGLTMTNFPGKYQLERRIMRQHAICTALNKIRTLAKKAPFDIPN
jgi:archaellum biogenesis protein FlaJ (TadC family)